MSMRNKVKEKKIVGDILRVSLSNIFILLSGILVGFLLPKVVGVSDYGYYKTFTLYATYVGIFHFGFVDGIYLKFGDKAYEELDKKLFRSFSKVLLIVEGVIALLFILVAIVVLKEANSKFIVVCLAVYLLFHNYIGFFQVISQITKRFGDLSKRNFIQSLLISCAVIGLYVLTNVADRRISYMTYTLIYLVITMVLMCWYMWTYRDLLFGASNSFRTVAIELVCLVRQGFPLLIANMCSTLMLTLDRQFVNVLFDNNTYAIYAFAYNMLSLVTTAIMAISTVLYPNLKRMGKDVLKSSYSGLVGGVLALVFGSLMIYFPLCVFVKWFLPDYVTSLNIFKVIFPGLGISSAITIVMHNYYKVLGKNIRFFVYSCIILLVSCGANIYAYINYGSPIAISAASIVVLLLWYIVAELYLAKEQRTSWIKNFTFLIIMMSVFYVTASGKSLVAGFIVYAIVFVLAVGVFCFRNIMSSLKDINKI